MSQSVADEMWGEGWEEELAAAMANRGYLSSDEFEKAKKLALDCAFNMECIEQVLAGYLDVFVVQGQLVFRPRGASGLGEP